MKRNQTKQTIYFSPKHNRFLFVLFGWANYWNGRMALDMYDIISLSIFFTPLFRFNLVYTQLLMKYAILVDSSFSFLFFSMPLCRFSVHESCVSHFRWRWWLFTDRRIILYRMNGIFDAWTMDFVLHISCSRLFTRNVVNYFNKQISLYLLFLLFFALTLLLLLGAA